MKIRGGWKPANPFLPTGKDACVPQHRALRDVMRGLTMLRRAETDAKRVRIARERWEAARAEEREQSEDGGVEVAGLAQQPTPTIPFLHLGGPSNSGTEISGTGNQSADAGAGELSIENGDLHPQSCADGGFAGDSDR